MTKMKHHVYGWLMIVAVAAAVFAVPKQAEAFVDETMPEVKYQKTLGISNDENVLVTSVMMGDKIKNAKKVTVKSSKTRIVEAKVAADNNISLFAQRPGKAAVKVYVTYKSGKKSTYPINVTVYKYINPIKKMTIGSKSFSFRKKSSIEWYPDPKKYDDVMVGKLKVTPNSGWKLKAIYTNDDKKVKNKTTVKIDGSHYTYYLVVLYNTEKHLTEIAALGINEWVSDDEE